MVQGLTSGYLLHIPVWQEGILGVPVDGVGHIPVGLEGEQVHHAGGEQTGFMNTQGLK